MRTSSSAIARSIAFSPSWCSRLDVASRLSRHGPIRPARESLRTQGRLAIPLADPSEAQVEAPSMTKIRRVVRSRYALRAGSARATPRARTFQRRGRCDLVADPKSCPARCGASWSGDYTFAIWIARGSGSSKESVTSKVRSFLLVSGLAD